MSAHRKASEQKLDPREVLARQGLRLPALTLKQLRGTGIYCQPSISIEHQHLARRYVLRGVESGGAVAEFGTYSSFVGEHGEPIGWLQRIDSVGVNGVHAIVIAPVLVRIEMVRIQRTYDLLITRHILVASTPSPKPRLHSEIIFFGRRGSLELELWGKDIAFRGSIAPVFYTRSGESAEVPKEFQRAAALITTAVCCVGCRHCHLLQPKPIEPASESVSPDREMATASRPA
ncbi:MAG TPA: hypothetical protein VFR24_04560 [Candidatus Angelobacter sp.]|nr:hypothetical protein [Candidatus Angelobacter sp.]